MLNSHTAHAHIGSQFNSGRFNHMLKIGYILRHLAPLSQWALATGVRFFIF